MARGDTIYPATFEDFAEHYILQFERDRTFTCEQLTDSTNHSPSDMAAIVANIMLIATPRMRFDLVKALANYAKNDDSLTLEQAAGLLD